MRASIRPLPGCRTGTGRSRPPPSPAASPGTTPPPRPPRRRRPRPPRTPRDRQVMDLVDDQQGPVRPRLGEVQRRGGGHRLIGGDVAGEPPSRIALVVGGRARSAHGRKPRARADRRRLPRPAGAGNPAAPPRPRDRPGPPAISVCAAINRQQRLAAARRHRRQIFRTCAACPLAMAATRAINVRWWDRRDGAGRVNGRRSRATCPHRGRSRFFVNPPDHRGVRVSFAQSA